MLVVDCGNRVTDLVFIIVYNCELRMSTYNN